MKFYNEKILLLFIGGLFSLLLPVIIICAKQFYKRRIERQRLEIEFKIRPEVVGDIEAKLDDSNDFKKPNFFGLLAQWGIQPLLIISFVSLFDQNSHVEIIGAFVLVLWTIIHEFDLSDSYSKNKYYQLIILVVWVLLFGLISYKANIKASKIPIPTETIKHSSDSLKVD